MHNQICATRVPLRKYQISDCVGVTTVRLLAWWGRHHLVWSRGFDIWTTERSPFAYLGHWQLWPAGHFKC